MSHRIARIKEGYFFVEMQDPRSVEQHLRRLEAQLEAIKKEEEIDDLDWLICVEPEVAEVVRTVRQDIGRITRYLRDLSGEDAA